MWDLFWELSQDQQIASANQRAAASGTQAAAAEQRVVDLERRVERLSLVCMAMWDLLREQPGLGEADLKNRMNQIDEADGVRDGRVGPSRVQCPSCGRNVSPRKGRCMYCGTTIASTTPFERI